MSFSQSVKAELCRVPVGNLCCAVAEAYGVLLFAGVFTRAEFRVSTSHAAFAHRLPGLFQTAFGVPLSLAGGAKRRWSFGTADRRVIDRVMGTFGYGGPLVALHLNNAMAEEPCCQAAFARGAFLSGGTVIHPHKKYQLQLMTPHIPLSREVDTLLRELGLRTRDSRRGPYAVISIKNSDSIEDFLTLAGAPISALALMETKIEKGVSNQVNRRVNCETANIAKTARAAVDQSAAIERLKGSAVWHTLPESLQTVGLLRLEHPEASLNELAALSALTAAPAGRSGINHRLRKLVDLAGETAAPP
jgi:hypothetical protein